MGLMNSDAQQLSLQEHELNYILLKFGKRETKENRLVLRNAELLFKASKGGHQTKNYTKDEFYDYCKEKGIVDKLM